MHRKIKFVDPPSGWKYGFPAAYDETKDGTLQQFLLKKGYPEKDIPFALLHMRSWIEEQHEK